MRISVLIAITLLSFASAAIGKSNDSRAVVILAGNISIRDIADPSLRNLNNLLRSGSVALMNTHTGRPSKDIEPTSPFGMEPGCVSLGAGAVAIGGAEVRRAGGVSGLINSVPAGALYKYRTGVDCGSAQVVHSELPKMQRANLAASYHARPGALGASLRKSGIRTAIVGNSDIPGDLHREAVAVAMDDRGIVDYGSVDSPSLIKADAKAPYGIETDTNALLANLDEVLSKSRFVVVDFGDTARADSYALFCTDDQAVVVRHQAALRLDKFVSQVTGRLDPKKDLLVLVSPSARSYSDIEQERLAPVLFKGPGFGPGMLTSASTRHDGIVTICDIAPTVLKHFGINAPSDMMGRPVSRVDHKDTVDALLKLNNAASFQAQRQVAMRGGSVVQSVVIILVMICVLLGISYSPKVHSKTAVNDQSQTGDCPPYPALGCALKGVIAWLALVPVSLPLAMLCLPLIYSGGLVGAIILLSVMTISIIALVAAIFRSPVRGFVWMCTVLVVGMTIDLLRGAPISSISITGYSLIEGARYYGIGNEMMGTVLGATLIGLGAALTGSKLSSKLKGIIVAAIFAVVFLSIGHPSLGANTGGALAAAPAMLVMMLARRGRKLNARGIAVVMLVTILVVGALFAVDAMHGNGTQSHMGRAVDMAKDSSGFGLLQVVQRKLAVNFMLVETSPWSRLLGISLVSSIVLFRLGKRRYGQEFMSNEQSSAALGCCFGIVCGFIFNDSGVLAAATCSVFLWILLVHRMIFAESKIPGGSVLNPPAETN